jgi:hypothetical protein
MQNEELAKKSLEIANSHWGVKELTGHNDGPFIWEIQKWFGGDAEKGAPWCAIFMSWCLYQAAEILGVKPVLPKFDSSTNIYAFAKSHHLLLDKPIAGCIGLIKGSGGTPGKTHHHTFRVTDVHFDLGLVATLDGNWGNCVARTTHRISDCAFVAVV